MEQPSGADRELRSFEEAGDLANPLLDNGTPRRKAVARNAKARRTGAIVATLVLGVGADVMISTWCFMWPERGRLGYLRRAHDWGRLYDFNYSSMDLWVLSVLRSTTVVATLLAARTKLRKSRFGSPVMPIPPALDSCVGFACVLSSCFLAVKLVAITYGTFKMHPAGVDIGLRLWLLLSFAAAVPSCLLEHRFAIVLLDLWRDKWAAAMEVKCPEVYREYQAKKREADEQRHKDRRTLSYMWGLAKLDTHILAVAFFCGCVASLATVLISYFIGKIVKFAAHDKDAREVRSNLCRLLVAIVTCSVFTSIRGGLFTLIGARLNRRVRSKLLHALIAMEQDFFDTTKTGELSSRLNTDTTTMANQISLNINVLVRSIVQIVFVVGVMLWTSWKLTLITFGVVPFTVVLAKLYGEFYRKITRKTQDALAEASAVADEGLSAMSTLKSMAGEEFVSSQYDTMLDVYLQLQRKESIAYALYAALAIFCPNAAMLATLAYGGSLALGGEMQGDDLYSFILYQQTLSQAFSNLGDIYSGLSSALGAADKVFELIDRKPTMAHLGTLAPADFQGRIDLQGVTFRYPSRLESPVLRDFSLSIPYGEVCALVGPSGSGKSSIIKLVERLYEPEKGSVALDGRHVAAYDKKWLARTMALVGQEPVLFACSIAENIAYGLDGKHKPTREQVVLAAKCANAHEFICDLSDGYDTQCGEKGMQLSGGQKQRIAIARAIARNPSILLLDEATSALDAESEAVVQEAIDKMIAAQSRTVVLVAHRLSTVQGANAIVVVSKGRVVEKGTHAELFERGGMYHKLVRKQMQQSQRQSESTDSIGGHSL